MSKSRFSCQIYSKLYFSWHARKIFKYQISWNSVSAYRPTDRNDEANSRISQFDAPNKEPFLSIFSQTQEVSITQVGNFVETRLLAVALNQADGQEMNETLAIFFESRILETELNRDKEVV